MTRSVPAEVVCLLDDDDDDDDQRQPPLADDDDVMRRPHATSGALDSSGLTLSIIVIVALI
jgi:hypothetical protein